MNIIVFGTGQIYKKYRILLEQADIHVVCLIDNDVNKIGSVIDGIKVDSPDNICNYEFEFVFVMSTYVEEITKQLRLLGVKQESIVDESSFYQHKDFVYRRVFESSSGKKLLLLSHIVNLSGASIALFHMAKVLKKLGYDVTVATAISADVEDFLFYYLNEKISVEIYADFKQIDVLEYDKKYDLIVANTVELFPLSEALSKLNIPILWWLHESESYYKLRYEERIKTFYKGVNFHVYVVGAIARNAYEKYIGENVSSELLYGIPEYASSVEVAKKDKMRYAVIGNVCKEKGQRFLLEVIKNNDEKWRNKAEFLFVGSISEAEKIEFEKNKNVKCLGVIKQEKMADIYGQIDVLICPSWFDTMPISVTEGFMNKKTCIISDVIGQAKYICPYKNGLIYKSGVSEELEERIQWTLENQHKLQDIGEMGYTIYKDVFSIKEFEKNILDIVTAII